MGSDTEAFVLIPIIANVASLCIHIQKALHYFRSRVIQKLFTFFLDFSQTSADQEQLQTHVQGLYTVLVTNVRTKKRLRQYVRYKELKSKMVANPEVAELANAIKLSMPKTGLAMDLLSCQNCRKEELKPRAFQKCARCKLVMYCSRECQKADWSSHKQNCKKNF